MEAGVGGGGAAEAGATSIWVTGMMIGGEAQLDANTTLGCKSG